MSPAPPGSPWLPELLADRPAHPRWRCALVELRAFAWHQALSCSFPVFIFAMLGATHWLAVPGMPRHDLLLLLCIIVAELKRLEAHGARSEAPSVFPQPLERAS